MAHLCNSMRFSFGLQQTFIKTQFVLIGVVAAVGYEDNLLAVNGGLTHHGEQVTADEDLSPSLAGIACRDTKTTSLQLMVA